MTQSGGILIRYPYPQVHRLFNPFPPAPPTPLYGGWVDKITRITTTRAGGTRRWATSRRLSTNGGGEVPRQRSARAGVGTHWVRSRSRRATAANLSEDRQRDASAFHSNSSDRQEVVSPRKRGRSREPSNLINAPHPAPGGPEGTRGSRSPWASYRSCRAPRRTPWPFGREPAAGALDHRARGSAAGSRRQTGSRNSGGERDGPRPTSSTATGPLAVPAVLTAHRASSPRSPGGTG